MLQFNMTREEFITDYTSDTMFEKYRTDFGYDCEGRKAFALPCRCGEDDCAGWAMIHAEGVGWHLSQNTDMRPPHFHSADEGEALAKRFFCQALS